MMFKHSTITLSCVSLLLSTASAFAGVTNGGFESGLTGWSTTGEVFDTDLEFERGLFGEPDWTATEGTYFAALFSTDNFGTDMSTLEQTFSADAGDILSFDYFFDFGDEEFFPDTARADLIGPSGSETLFEFNEGGGLFLGDFENFGWSSLSHALSDTGSYTLSFSIVDFDGSFESILGVDDVQVAVIPAPGAALLAMLGFGTVGWVKRRFA